MATAQVPAALQEELDRVHTRLHEIDVTSRRLGLAMVAGATAVFSLDLTATPFDTLADRSISLPLFVQVLVALCVGWLTLLFQSVVLGAYAASLEEELNRSLGAQVAYFESYVSQRWLWSPKSGFFWAALASFTVAAGATGFGIVEAVRASGRMWVQVVLVFEALVILGLGVTITREWRRVRADLSDQSERVKKEEVYSQQTP